MANVASDIQPLDYFRVFYRRRWISLLVVLLATAAGAFYTWRTVPVYEAQATLLIESDEPHVVNFQEVLDQGVGQGDYYQTQYQLLESRALAARTVQALDLVGRPAVGASTEAAAVSVLRGGLRVVPVRGTRLVNIRFRWHEPSLAAEIANGHARAYIEQSLDIRFRASKEATDWLDRQLAEERARVAERESALQAFRERHDALSLQDGQDIVVQKLADLNTAVTRAKTSRIQHEAQYRELLAAQRSRNPLDAFPLVLANGFIQQLKADLARVQREYSQLAQTLGDRHPTLIEKRTEVETTEARLAAEIRKVADSVTKAYEASVAEEASLVRALEQQKQEALALNRRGIEYAALEREAESVRSVYQSLLQRAKETSVSRELRATNIRIIDAAEPPAAPILPRPRTNLAIAFLAGCFVAVALVVGLELLDERLKTPDEVRRQLGVSFLGLVPKVKRVHAAGTAMLQPGAPPALVEATRAVRTALLSVLGDQRRATILVASASAGEGKTFLASNLAIALAQANYRVLLVDTDMRRPRVHRVFDQALEPGLSNLLEGAASFVDVLKPSSVRGLTIMSAGAPSSSAPELLGSTVFSGLLDVMREHYDYVVIDSPPVLGVTDATVVAGRVDRVLMVVGSGVTRAKAARLALEELQRAGGRVMGAVLNRADVQRHPFYFEPYGTREYRYHDDARGIRAVRELGRSA